MDHAAVVVVVVVEAEGDGMAWDDVSSVSYQLKHCILCSIHVAFFTDYAYTHIRIYTQTTHI
jgi:hypothetical protein